MLQTASELQLLQTGPLSSIPCFAHSGRRCRISMGPRQPKMFASSSDDGMDSAAVLAASSFASFGFFEWGRYNLSVRCLWQVFHVLPLVVWALLNVSMSYAYAHCSFLSKVLFVHPLLLHFLRFALCFLRTPSFWGNWVQIKRSLLHRLSFATRLMQTPCSALLVW